MTFKDYIKRLEDDGYISTRDGAPIKCFHCDNEDLYNHNFDDGGLHFTVEYNRTCKNCNKLIGVWAYGTWELIYE